MEYWMGIDLGGTKIRAGAVDRNGTVAALRESYTKDAADADRLREQIIAMGSRIMEEYPIQGAGMCFPGVIMADKTLQHATNLPGGMLAPEFITSIEHVWNIPVFVENDANAAAFGEYIHGCKGNVESMYYVTISTGIGGGYIWKGNILQGYQGFAGEVGSILVEEGDRSFRGLAPGAAEGCASGSAVLEQGKKGISPRINDAGEVFRLAALGDDRAREIVDRMTTGLARMFAAISMVINPQVFVLGGGCMKSSDLFLDEVVHKYKALVPEAVQDILFKPACLEEPGIVGCAEIARARLS